MRMPLLILSVAVLLLVAGKHGPEAVPAAADHRFLASKAVSDTMNAVCVMPAKAQRQMRRAESGAQAASDPAAPLRRIRDEYPSFAAIAVDVARDEVVMTDESLFQVLVYDRTENTPAGVAASKPKRTIAGEHTYIEFQSGVAVDQKTGDIYAANNDTRDALVIFKHGTNGDVKPSRQIETPHGTFGIVIDEVHDEIFLTEQHDSALVVYRKGATEKESPIRYLQGLKTGLQDPHGIALDPKDDVIFVANHGSTHDVALTDTPKPGVTQAGNRHGKENWPLGREFAVAGSGTINPPSITVYARKAANGNTPPLRTIKGPDTGLNWPTGLAFNPETRELFVANDASHEILVFDAAANGNVRPKRVLKGPRTKLTNPTSVFADTKNGELWVANFGGHSATVFDIAASGDAAPKRIIRNAPEGTPSLMIGNPGAVGYDTKRDEILVPN
jgi:DNA-binding beta-propeller fold protein YncE